MKSITKIVNNLSLLIILLLLVFSPIPYGSVEQWSKNILQLQIFFLFFLLSLLLVSNNYILKIPKGFSKFLVFGFFLLLIIQLIPIPEFFLKIIASKNLKIWKENQEILNIIGFNDKKNFYTISLYPFATWKETLLLISYFIFGLCVSVFCNSRKRVFLVIVGVLIISILEASIGIYQYISIDGEKYATGTYVNRNHFSGFIELTSFLLIGYALSLKKYKKNNISNVNTNLMEVIYSDNLYKQSLIIFIICIIVVSLFLASSRMAIFCFISTITFFFFMLKKINREDPGDKLLILFAIFVISSFVLFIGLYPIFKRFLETVGEAPGRVFVWKDCLNIIKDYPLFGTGLDTFRYIYPQYKTIEKAVRFNFAHNDYLQLMIETGIIGFLLLTIPLINFLKYSINKIFVLSKNKDFFGSYIRLGALCGVLSILIHSLVDFNLHIPANALYFSMLIGLIFTDFKETFEATVK